MLMDSMAYLQQIAGVDNGAAQNAKKGGSGILGKIFNIWTVLGTLVLVLIIVIVVVVVTQMNKVDTKDRDLMAKSYWTATYLGDVTIKKYAKLVKNSDIRNMTASLNSVLSEIKNNDKDIVLKMSNVNVSKMKKTDDIPKEALAENNKLNAVLEDARLNGILDRVFLREMTMQIAYLRSYQSEIVSRTKNAAAVEFSKKAEANLGNLYEQFHNFKSNTI